MVSPCELIYACTDDSVFGPFGEYTPYMKRNCLIRGAVTNELGHDNTVAAESCAELRKAGTVRVVAWNVIPSC